MTKERFQNLCKQMIEMGHEGHIQRVCKEFEVARSTFDRWASGIAVPLPNGIEKIVKFIENIYAW